MALDIARRALLLLVAFTLWDPPAPLNAAPVSPVLRVALAWGSHALDTALITGSGTVHTSAGSFGFRHSVRATTRSGGFTALRIDDVDVTTRLPVTVRADDPIREPLVLNGSRFRGTFELSEDRQGIRVINLVRLEEYVKGVVSNEMFSHLEAFRVQAVVSRTLALYIAYVERRWQNHGFDLISGGGDQVYGGASSESFLSNMAVDDTQGFVLTLGGQVIFAAFDANAGGHTEAVDVVWPGSVAARFPYLSPTPSPYDQAALQLRGYEWVWEWSRTLSREDVRGSLQRAGMSMGEIHTVRATHGGPSRRLVLMEIAHSGGVVTLEGADPIRRVLGIPGARATAQWSQDGLRIDGSGLGHGVGLSQHGAWGMGRDGYRYPEILSRYYRGVQLQRMDARLLPPGR